ncbi:hypothetical protein OY14_04505 (plasmid) [Borreliella chilensis]|uniref:Lipoprotein n=1 Tax=Borreliella chilensis TaxID=1245910 RepID=A0A0A7UX92_9SPIR|nr:hypothetical protein OY14_04505 [Borreliella chilensis]
MINRVFVMYLLSGLIFLFSCNLFVKPEDIEKSNFTDKQRLKALEAIKSQLNGDFKKIARVDKYFEQVGDSKRDVVLQLFLIGFEYIKVKESKDVSSNIDALKSDFESKLKQFNYTEDDFNSLVEEFTKFIESV